MREKSIEILNKAVADELQAVHQYMYFHFHCDDQGYDPVSGLFKRIAIEEMIHVEKIAERILFLKGEVELTPAGSVIKEHDIAKMLAMTKKMEEGAIIAYNKWANECSANADAMSKKLFEELIADEERHFDLFETQDDHLKRFGKQFLALQSIERSKKNITGSQGSE